MAYTGPTGADAAFGTLPVLRQEREFSFFDFTWINIGLAIATWAFLLGGSTALFVDAKHGIAAIVIGNVIGVAIMALAVCVASGKYGIEQFTVLRSAFGRVGVKALVALFLAVYGIGWASVLSIMFGRAATQVTNEVAGTAFSPNALIVSLLALVAIAIAWLLLWSGPTAVKWLNRFVGPGKIILCAGLLILIFNNASWGQISSAKPLEPFADTRLNFMIAVELNLAAGFGWWPVLGNLSRMTRTPRAAVWPNMIGVFAAAALGEIVGLLAALSLGASDPTAWMIPLGGAILGVIVLLFIGLANITAIVSIYYGMCLAMRQAGGKMLERTPWVLLTGILFVPVMVAVFFPATIYDNFFKFLAWTALGFAPLSGIATVDYFVLRRQRLSMRALYQRQVDSSYEFWRGVNPAAVISLLAGAGMYFLLLNPSTLISHGPFDVITASLPACGTSAIVHYALTKLIVARSGRGGYRHSVHTA